MTNARKLSAGMVCLTAGMLLMHTVNAQLTVAANGSAGIGNTNPQGKLEVTLNPADTHYYAGRFFNNRNTNLTKYGVLSQVNTAGTGGRYGLYNITQSAGTSNGFTYGQYNSTTGGNGLTLGLYNISSGGNGFKYGLYNYMAQSSATGGGYGLLNYAYFATTSGTGLYNYTYSPGTGNYTGYGIYNIFESRTAGTSYGIYNQVAPFSSSCPPGGPRYGIFNEVSTAGPGIRYGIYSSTPGTANFAGYFVGNVYVQGNLTVTSDDRLKTGVSSMTNALDVIKQLDAKTYTFRKDMKGLRLAEGSQVGLLASDVEKALPALVSEVNAPIDYDPIEFEPLCWDIEVQKSTGVDANGNPVESELPKLRPVKTPEGNFYKLKSVNYTALIPVLVQAVKEQQKTIDELKQVVEKQQALIGKLLPAGK